MRLEEQLGLLLAAGALGFFVYCCVRIGHELLTGKGSSRKELRAAVSSSLIRFVLDLYIFTSFIVFLGLIVFGGLIFKDGRSMIYIWIPASWIVVWVIKAILPTPR